MVLDPLRVTESDRAWAALSGSTDTAALSQQALAEAVEQLAGWAVSRNGWTEDTRNELADRAARCGLSDPQLPDVTTVEYDLDELLTPGARVTFTGTRQMMTRTRGYLSVQEACDLRGLVYRETMTKTTTDVLIAKDTSTRSGKGKRAAELGKPIISLNDFTRWFDENPTRPDFDEQDDIEDVDDVADIDVVDTMYEAIKVSESSAQKDADPVDVDVDEEPGDEDTKLIYDYYPYPLELRDSDEPATLVEPVASRTRPPARRSQPSQPATPKRSPQAPTPYDKALNRLVIGLGAVLVISLVGFLISEAFGTLFLSVILLLIGLTDFFALAAAGILVVIRFFRK